MDKEFVLVPCSSKMGVVYNMCILSCKLGAFKQQHVPPADLWYEPLSQHSFTVLSDANYGLLILSCGHVFMAFALAQNDIVTTPAR